MDRISAHFGWRRKLPLLLQTEAMECGLACLAMVAGFHGYETDLAQLRQRFSISLKGANLKQIMAIAESLQLSCRALRVEMEALSYLKMPCILHWDMNHFVVLREANSKGIVIHDPAVGLRRLTYSEASKHFTGVVLELQPSEAFTPANVQQHISISKVMGRVTGLKSGLAQIIGIAFALELIALTAPLFMQLVVDQAVVANDYSLVSILGIGFLLLALIHAGLSAARSWAVLYLSTSVNLQWLSNVFEHLLRLPVEYFEKRHLGDVISRFSAVSVIQRTLTTSGAESVLDGVMVIVALSMMFIYSAKIALITLGAFVIHSILRYVLYRASMNATAEQIIYQARQQTHVLETIRGIQAIKLFGREDDRRRRWQNFAVTTANRDVRVQQLVMISKVGTTLLFGVERIAVIWLGALFVLDGILSVGMLFAFVSYKEQFTARLITFSDKLVEIAMLRLHAERLADIVLTAPEKGNDEPVIDTIPVNTISIENVSFRYGDTEDFVLKECSFTVSPGEYVAVVGSSGCGKTTMMKIMLGLLTPTQGRVLINGLDMQQFGIRAYRESIGIVMQDDQLFAGSIAENISFFDPEPDREHIEHAAKLAAIHDDIVAMPMRYHTLIGDMGTALSGGQRQRLLLARALYRQPSLLFLDEATSHLDVEKEKQVNATLRSMDLTCIIIAHRPETIASADRVIRLSAGQVVGDHPQLCKVV